MATKNLFQKLPDAPSAGSNAKILKIIRQSPQDLVNLDIHKPALNKVHL